MSLARASYSTLLYALSPLIIQRIWREQLPGYRRTQRLGFGLGTFPAGPRIWLHCASVGEVRAARGLIEGLLARYPEHILCVTTMTATGARQVHALADELGKPRLVHRFVALDFPGAARRFVAALAPALGVLFETELWPNLIDACARQGVPTALVNGRISPRAFKRYRAFTGVMRETLGKLDWIAAKSPADAERLEALGAPPARMAVVGSLKFDMTLSSTTREQGERLRATLAARPVWVAGSTREGEEEQVLAAHRTLCQRFPDALLVLAPRHPQRFDAVAALIERQGFGLARRSRGEAITAKTQVYLGDTLGELGVLYAAGSVAFVGGSLVPLGGHNVVEPALLGLPVLCGPSLENFDDVAAPLLDSGALMRVMDASALANAIADRWEAPSLALEQGTAGHSVVMAQRGALARTLAGLDALLAAGEAHLDRPF